MPAFVFWAASGATEAAMPECLKELLDARAKHVHDARQILDRAETEKRNLSTEERASYDKLDAEIDALTGRIDGLRDQDHVRQRRAHYDRLMSDTGFRQTAPSRPFDAGSNPGRGEPLTVDFRGRKITLQPGTPAFDRASPEYRQALAHYILTGEPRRESLGLQVSSDPKGGYLASTQMAARLIQFLDDQVFIRQLATVLPPIPDSVSLGVPTLETDPGDADWTAEVPASDIAEDDAMTLGKREFTPHLATKLVKLSMKMLRSGIFDVEDLAVRRVGYKFGVTEEKAFLTGDGNQKALGAFTASADGIPTTRDVVAASQTAIAADELIDVKYSLKEAYQARSTWVAHRDFVKRVRKLKDTQNQYLWQPGLSSDRPDTILDRPYRMSEFAPNTFTANNYVAILGDWTSGYWIIDSLQLELQRLSELFSLKNQVGLLVRKETDGAPVLGEAFARYKLAP